MAISDYQRTNLKKFIRSGTYVQDCKELGIPTTNVTKALVTKDDDFFFVLYDKLVSRGWVKDEVRRLKLPNGIDDDYDVSMVPPRLKSLKPKATHSTLPVLKPTPTSPPQNINNSSPMLKKPKVRYNLLIDEDLLERLKVESLEVDRSVSSLIRISIINYLDKTRSLK